MDGTAEYEIPPMYVDESLNLRTNVRRAIARVSGRYDLFLPAGSISHASQRLLVAC